LLLNICVCVAAERLCLCVLLNICVCVAAEHLCLCVLLLNVCVCVAAERLCFCRSVKDISKVDERLRNGAPFVQP